MNQNVCGTIKKKGLQDQEGLNQDLLALNASMLPRDRRAIRLDGFGFKSFKHTKCNLKSPNFVSFCVILIYIWLKSDIPDFLPQS